MIRYSGLLLGPPCRCKW